MQAQTEQIVHLLDTDERQLGQIVIEQQEDDAVGERDRLTSRGSCHPFIPRFTR
jgi:hypothetical protein